MTPQEQQLEIEKLKKQVAEFEAFMEKIDVQQLTFPLDELSQKVISTEIVTRADIDLVPFGLATYNESTKVLINGKNFLLDTTEFYPQY